MTETGVEVEQPLSPREIIDKGTNDLTSMYANVEPGSVSHRALLHLIACETAKHRAMESQARLQQAQEDDINATSIGDPDAKIFDEIHQDEQAYWEKTNDATDAVLHIVTAQREKDPLYHNISTRTEAVISLLEDAHEKLGTEKPFAAISMMLRKINEGQILRSEPKVDQASS